MFLIAVPLMAIVFMGCGGVRGTVPVSPMLFLKNSPAPAGTPLVASSIDYTVTPTE